MRSSVSVKERLRSSGAASKRHRREESCRSSATWPGHAMTSLTRPPSPSPLLALRTAHRLLPPRRDWPQPLLADWKLNMRVCTNQKKTKTETLFLEFKKYLSSSLFGWTKYQSQAGIKQFCWHHLGRFRGQGKFWLGKKFKDRFFIGKKYHYYWLSSGF